MGSLSTVAVYVCRRRISMCWIVIVGSGFQDRDSRAQTFVGTETSSRGEVYEPVQMYQSQAGGNTLLTGGL